MNNRLAQISLVLPALAIALGGCGTSTDVAEGSSSGSKASGSASPVDASASSKADEPSKADEGDQEVIAAAKQAVSDAEALGADWVSFVKAYEVKSGVLWISTSLYPDSDAKKPASAICGTMKASLNPFPGVSVRASTGDRLVQAKELSDPC